MDEFLKALNDIRRQRGLPPLEKLPLPPYCSFCGEGRNDVAALVEGREAFICDRCAAEAQRMMGRPQG